MPFWAGGEGGVERVGRGKVCAGKREIFDLDLGYRSTCAGLFVTDVSMGRHRAELDYDGC